MDSYYEITEFYLSFIGVPVREIMVLLHRTVHDWGISASQWRNADTDIIGGMNEEPKF